jgi:vitamin B12 transporter
VVAGLDYDDTLLKASDTLGVSLRGKNNKFAFYVNDTIRLGKLTVTPGIRYDNERLVKDFISPSLGATYELGDKSLLRAVVSRGFSSPIITQMQDNPVYGYVGNQGIRPEKVWSYQVGIETGALKYLWLKASAFRHDISDAIVQEYQFEPVFSYSDLNKGRIRRQGIEAEARTLPFHHFTLSAGVCAAHIKNRDTGEVVHEYPKYTYDVSLKYDDEKTVRGLLTGHYIWFDSSTGGTYNAWVVDLNLSKKIYKQQEREAEIFLTGHNLFDGYQHLSKNYFNAKRWMEAGIRFKF